MSEEAYTQSELPLQTHEGVKSLLRAIGAFLRPNINSNSTEQLLETRSINPLTGKETRGNEEVWQRGDTW